MYALPTVYMERICVYSFPGYYLGPAALQVRTPGRLTSRRSMTSGFDVVQLGHDM